MKQIFLGAAVAVTLPLAGPAQGAGIIEGACMKSDRSAATAALCNCIQGVADQILAPHEQRKGAAFFADPHKSQETRQSGNDNDWAFWLKWKDYGDIAAKACG
ncbi:hypothetical protein [Maritimibacter sp. UBA3975]|uniref:hypothetical protein n=1 Tax=Maritimibacter sp. UBA3975 TaxID=1946833 RepID=UPI000C08F7D6|nr:hypothetical protein [Maritimibacter sp. UBA3975]MAM62294.1 hypothetical protein [Maritimibacter sp.]|tara:strand:+ start:392 stop:700 length:309 start_codon:yes stop_codon:yes gene_type:complete